MLLLPKLSNISPFYHSPQECSFNLLSRPCEDLLIQAFVIYAASSFCLTSDMAGWPRQGYEYEATTTCIDLITRKFHAHSIEGLEEYGANPWKVKTKPSFCPDTSWWETPDLLRHIQDSNVETTGVAGLNNSPVSMSLKPGGAPWWVALLSTRWSRSDSRCSISTSNQEMILLLSIRSWSIELALINCAAGESCSQRGG